MLFRSQFVSFDIQLDYRDITKPEAVHGCQRNDLPFVAYSRHATTMLLTREAGIDVCDTNPIAKSRILNETISTSVRIDAKLRAEMVFSTGSKV